MAKELTPQEQAIHARAKEKRITRAAAAIELANEAKAKAPLPVMPTAEEAKPEEQAVEPVEPEPVVEQPE